jgi:hypothetical protein
MHDKAPTMRMVMCCCCCLPDCYRATPEREAFFKGLCDLPALKQVCQPVSQAPLTSTVERICCCITSART